MLYVALLLSVLVPFSSLALPVVGETVVYSGKARLADGDYEIRKTMTVLSFDSETREYTVRTTFEQSAEGAALGAYDVDAKVKESYYQAIKMGLIPTLQKECGQTFRADDPQFTTVTTRETVETPMGSIEACRLEYPTKANGELNITWWSAETSPWPVQGIDRSIVNGTELKITIESRTRP